MNRITLILGALALTIGLSYAEVWNCKVPDPIDPNNRCLQCNDGFYKNRPNDYYDYCYLCNSTNYNGGCAECTGPENCTKCIDDTFTLNNGFCQKNCETVNDCVGFLSSSDSQIICLKPADSKTDQKVCAYCETGQQCEQNFPGMNFTCSVPQYPYPAWEKQCGQCRQDTDCPSGRVCDVYSQKEQGVSVTKCVECTYDGHCQSNPEFSAQGKLYCLNNTCINDCHAKQLESCTTDAAEKQCGCKATYYRVGCFMECNNIDVSGVCKVGWVKPVCRDETWDHDEKYVPSDKRCFHKDTVVIDAISGEEKTLEQIAQGDRVVSVELENEPILVKLIHEKDDTMAKVFKFTLENGLSLIVTPGHYMLVQNEGSDLIAHIPSELVVTGDLMVMSGPEFPRAKILSIDEDLVPSSDLIHVYTPSGTLLVNGGILASTKTEFDLSEYHMPLMNLLYTYISASAPQQLANLASKLRLSTAIKTVYSYFQ